MIRLPIYTSDMEKQEALIYGSYLTKTMRNRSEGESDLRKKDKRSRRLFFFYIRVSETSKENKAKICGHQ